MPIERYFVFVGSVLLALLLLSDRYLPEQIASSGHADIDRSVIRIHSRHKWPEAVVYDTSLPTIVSPAVAAVVSPERPPLEAFAQLLPAPASTRLRVGEMPPKAVAVKRVAKPRPSVKRASNYQPFESRGFFQVGW